MSMVDDLCGLMLNDHCMSPASWTATADGPGAAACREPPATPKVRRIWPRVVRLAVKRDVGWLTVFGFSTENWVRPRIEVRHILGLHKKLFGRVAELNELNVRVQWIGRPFDSPDARTPGLRAEGDPQGHLPTRPATRGWC